MKPLDILHALDNESITTSEAAAKLAQHSDPLYLASAYLTARTQCQAVRDELTAERGARFPCRLGRSNVADLIDHAMSTDHLTPAQAKTYLCAEGMLESIADRHISTMQAIANKDAQRAAHLADPNDTIAYCTRCGKATMPRWLSNRGICVQCSEAAADQNIAELRAQKGPYYERWAKGILTALDHLIYEQSQRAQARPPSPEANAIDCRTVPDCYGDPGEHCEPDCAYRQTCAIQSAIPPRSPSLKADMYDHDKRPPCFGDLAPECTNGCVHWDACYAAHNNEIPF